MDDWMILPGFSIFFHIFSIFLSLTWAKYSVGVLMQTRGEKGNSCSGANREGSWGVLRVKTWARSQHVWLYCYGRKKYSTLLLFVGFFFDEVDVEGALMSCDTEWRMQRQSMWRVSFKTCKSQQWISVLMAMIWVSITANGQVIRVGARAIGFANVVGKMCKAETRDSQGKQKYTLRWNILKHGETGKSMVRQHNVLFHTCTAFCGWKECKSTCFGAFLWHFCAAKGHGIWKLVLPAEGESTSRNHVVLGAFCGGLLNYLVYAGSNGCRGCKWDGRPSGGRYMQKLTPFDAKLWQFLKPPDWHDPCKALADFRTWCRDCDVAGTGGARINAERGGYVCRVTRRTAAAAEEPEGRVAQHFENSNAHKLSYSLKSEIFASFSVLLFLKNRQ